MTIDLADVVAAVVLGLLGNGLLGSYLLQWHQAESDGKLERLKTELEREVRSLQTALDRTIFVHRAQFDTEFAALRDIWAKVAEVRAKMGMVRPLMDLIPAGETEVQRNEREFRRFSEFYAALNALVHAVDSQSPFVPRDIYLKVEAVMQIARGEALEVQVERGDRDRQIIRDWYQRGRENFRQVCDEATQLSDLIRTRLEQLNVVGER